MSLSYFYTIYRGRFAILCLVSALYLNILRSNRVPDVMASITRRKASAVARSALNAFVDGAVSLEESRESSLVNGVIRGSAIAVKANLCAKGWPASAGSKMLASE